MDVVNLKWIVIDGLLFSLGLGISMLIALYLNPRVMLQDYPESIKSKVPPQTAAEKRQQLVLGLVWLVIIAISLIHFIGQFRAESSNPLSFPVLFLNIYLLFMVFNVFDLVVLDLLILTVWRPKALYIQGMENFNFENPVRFHTIAFVKGVGIIAIPSLIVSVIATLLVK